MHSLCELQSCLNYNHTGKIILGGGGGGGIIFSRLKAPNQLGWRLVDTKGL